MLVLGFFFLMWFINEEKHKEYFKILESKVALDKFRIPKSNPFEIFELLEPQEIKVVIIGQDPYATKGYFDGIAFSARYSNVVPQSLQVLKKLFINTELKTGTPVGKVPNDLRYLVKQGVFFSNLAWTTSEGNPGAHLFEEWITFSIRLVNFLSFNHPYIRFILLGNRASILKQYINPTSIVYLEQHPAADRYKKTIKKLEDSNVLININSSLKSPIKWTLY